MRICKNMQEPEAFIAVHFRMAEVASFSMKKWTVEAFLGEPWPFRLLLEEEGLSRKKKNTID